jgi:hypothetical protein
MNKEKLLIIINKYVGYAEQEIYDAIAKYDEEKISFAKLHVEAALKAKIEAMEEYMNDGYDLEEIDSFTYNAYPLNNIK